MAAMLVYLDKRILNIFFWKYTNMAANFFVVLIPRDWVKTLYWSSVTTGGNRIAQVTLFILEDNTIIQSDFKKNDYTLYLQVWV